MSALVAGRCDDGRVRHLLLALAVCAALAPSAQAQPAVPQTTQSSSPKKRLAEVLELSKRKDAKAVSDVSQRLMTDTDPTIRRVAALALDRMVDAATDNTARALEIGRAS